MMLLHAPLLSTPLVFPDAVQVKVSAQIQVPSAAAEDQDLEAMQSHSSVAPSGGAGVTQPCWAQHWSPTMPPAHQYCGQGYVGTHTAQTCSSPTPRAGGGLRELCAAPQPVEGKVRSFLRPLSKALSTHTAT